MQLFACENRLAYSARVNLHKALVNLAQRIALVEHWNEIKQHKPKNKAEKNLLRTGFLEKQLRKKQPCS